MTTLPEEAVKAAPCPRCASQNVYIEPDERGSGGQWVLPVHIGCSDCGINLVCNEADTVEDAISHWNERALHHLPRVGVKKLEWELVSGDHYAEGAGTHYNIYQTKPDLWNSVTVRPGNVRLATNVDLEAAKAAAQADYEARILSAIETGITVSQPSCAKIKAARKAVEELANTPMNLPLEDWSRISSAILSALEPSAVRELALEEILREVDEIERRVWAWSGSAFLNNELEGAEDTDCKTELYSELCRIGNAMHWLRTKICALSSPDHADAVRERAWYFSAGDAVPEWLEKIEKGNCTLTFGVDVVVTSKDGGYEVRPQGIADNAGPILHVVSHGNVTPEIKGGGNGVAIIGYNRPYDETAEGKIERLKRLLEMALPYVECYDTREHNAEQDAVLTEIDKALSVLTEGDHIDDAGKVEGDGWSMSPPKFHRYPYFVENISGKWCLCKHHGNGASHTISVHETAREARDAAPASEGAE